MQSYTLHFNRLELIEAFRVLGTTRRQRFRSTLPVWLNYKPDAGVLDIEEDKGAVVASIMARGSWPPFGATIDLFSLRRILERCSENTIQLHASSDAILFACGDLTATLKLQPFGVDAPVEDHERILEGFGSLPLFAWADRRKKIIEE